METAVLSCLILLAGVVPSEQDVTVTVLHTNDVHSHFLQSSRYGGKCAKDCVGGVARHLQKVTEVKSSIPDALFLNGGDYYQGTVWYYSLRSSIVSEVVKMLKHDAMSLGNHEFDDKPEGLQPFLKDVRGVVPVLACNVDFSKEAFLRDYALNASKVFNIRGHKVAVIGYLTPETSTLSSPGPNVVITDEIEGIQKEVTKLKQEGVQIFIALGHSGVYKDIEIAEKIPEIGLVVGGHSHSFLYTGTPPSNDQPVLPYPKVVERSDGSKGLVVQAFWFGKYMGFINVTFTSDGKVVNWQGQPILLDKSVRQDPEIEATLQKYVPIVDEYSKRQVGKTKVLLKADGNLCRGQECNMGNFITDCFLDYFLKTSSEGTIWMAVNGAAINGGSIRTSINEQENEGNITYENLIDVLPFGNNIYFVKLTGKKLKSLFEHSVQRYDPNGIELRGEFLQVAGIRVTYNVMRPALQRVMGLEIRCSRCRVPRYEPVVEDSVYTILVSDYIINGGDGYDFSDIPSGDFGDTGKGDLEPIKWYLNRYSPVTSGLDNRIRFVSGAVPTTTVAFSVLLLTFFSSTSKLFQDI